MAHIGLPLTATEYRIRARECRDLAKFIGLNSDKKILEEMALNLERLAIAAESQK